MADLSCFGSYVDFDEDCQYCEDKNICYEATFDYDEFIEDDTFFDDDDGEEWGDLYYDTAF